MQPLGFLFSLILHTLILATIIFWPASTPKKIDSERYLISMVIGDMGGENLPSPVAGIRQPKEQAPSILPDSQPQAQEADKPAVETPKQEVPQEKPEATPIPKKPEPEPEQPKEIAQTQTPEPKKEEPKKEPEKKKEPEPKKQEPKKEPQKPVQKKNTGKKNSIADALKEAKKQDKAKGGSVSNALAELEGMQQMGGGGGTGSGNGGGGIYDVYAAQVILAVQPNWSMPTYSRQNLVVQVHIKLDISGTVLSAEIVEGSGRADFDASAVNAVLRTKVLPKPPTKDQQDLIISFNALELAGN